MKTKEFFKSFLAKGETLNKIKEVLVKEDDATSVFEGIFLFLKYIHESDDDYRRLIEYFRKMAAQEKKIELCSIWQAYFESFNNDLNLINIINRDLYRYLKQLDEILKKINVQKEDGKQFSLEHSDNYLRESYHNAKETTQFFQDKIVLLTQFYQNYLEPRTTDNDNIDEAKVLVRKPTPLN